MPERIASESAVRMAIKEKEDAINKTGPKDVSLAGKELFKVINKTWVFIFVECRTNNVGRLYVFS